MVKESIAIQETVNFLNEILKYDPVAITAMFSLRVACNKDLADHKTVQVGALSKSYFQVGMIGILNGLFGADKYRWGHISADYDNRMIKKFRLLSEKDVKTIIRKQ